MMNCVILCGGSGSRLWPLSREKLPKQLLPIVNDQTMLQNTLLRFANLNINKFILICNKEHYFLIEKQVAELGITNALIVTEPMGRDTCAAVAIGTLLGDPEQDTLVVPSDHVFDDGAFEKVVQNGLGFTNDFIVTFGIKPTRPDTGYGYIETDPETSETINFVEKPDLEKATEYFESGKYYWNAGVFLFKNKNMFDCYKRYAQDVLEMCHLTLVHTPNYTANYVKANATNCSILHLHRPLFIQCRPISIDYAIMEELCKDTANKMGKITIPYNSTWCDVGSFGALHDFLDGKDKDGNIVKGDALIQNTKNCYIDTERTLVALSNVQDLVIVNTRDALLICDRNKTQDVKKIVDDLKYYQRPERIVHAREYRPWGWYCNIESNNYGKMNFKVKHIVVYPGKRLSLQSHERRSEHWVIVRGTGKMQLGGDTLTLAENQHIYIPKQTQHRIENIGSDLLEFVETQIGDYLGENDIVRYEDDYGRT
jgi:mannose-1-phosphate guanylyltransferase/mannose-6-phosphate isomerase